MISVIIPCFNSEQHVTRAIESVLNQTYNDYEIVLVDNNSTDNTHNILKSYEEKHPKLIKTFKEYKKGAPAARNKGLHEVNGEWLQFLDSDDELLPNKFKNQMEVALSSNADIIVSECHMYKATEMKVRSVETGDVWQALIGSKLGSTTTNLWKKEAILSVGGWNETKTSSQEYELMFRMLKHGSRVAFCPMVLSIMHRQENSISNSADINRFSEILENNITLRLQIKEYLKSRGRLTKQLEYKVETYIYSLLVYHKERVPAYVKRKLKESHLKLPVKFLLKFYFDRLNNKVKRKFFS